MNVLILNGSPKKKGGTSHFILSVFRLMLLGNKVSKDSLHSKSAFSRIMEKLPSIDALVLSVPLYVDGIPAHVQEFLEQAEAFCRENNCSFTLYVISNNGFIEGKQNKTHLMMYQCWCQRAGIGWGGGIGIGGGVMYHVISIVFPIMLVMYLLFNLINIISGHPVTAAEWQPFVSNALIYIFLSSGIFYCMTRLAYAVRRRAATANRYTRVLVPSFVFIIVSDIFMIISSLFNGRFVFMLLGRDVYDQEIVKK